MAEVSLPVVLVLTATKTFLVVDAVFFVGRGSGAVAHAAQAIRSQVTSQPPARSSAPTLRQQSPKGPTSAGATKARGLHVRLLVMHVTSVIGQSVGAAKYLLPVSNTSCTVTYRLSSAMFVLYDASLITFLLAKVDVTNGTRTLACWEKGIVWWSRFHAWIYLPAIATYVAFTFPGHANSDRTFCYNEFGNYDEIDFSSKEVDVRNYVLGSAVLIVEFVLLLVMFVKPMLVRVEGAQSGGAIYRRVVSRNITCTVCIIVSYVIATAITAVSTLRQSPESNKFDQIKDVTSAMNCLSTLCLPEIALPLGFTS